LLAWFLEKTETKLADYVPVEEAYRSFNEGSRVFVVSFPIEFTPDSFHMSTKSGPVDLKRLDLRIEFTVTPKFQT
jgi:hypothetical protein